MQIRKFTSIILSLTLVTLLVSCGGGSTGQVRKDTDSSSKKNAANRGQATGYATIFDNDQALARDRATLDAQNKLVAKILGETVSGSSTMQDFEMVSIVVEAKSYGLVRDMEIIKHGPQDSMYNVTIEGTVEMAAVENAIRDALNRYGRPKFMVLVQEKFEGKQNQPGFTETELAINEVMGNSGFEFVDAGITQQWMNKEKAKMDSAMNGQVNQDVQQLLLNTIGADVIIIGTAETGDQTKTMKKFAGKDSDMKSKQAIVRLKAIDVYTGNILAATSKDAPGMHIDQATASKRAIVAVMKQILGKTSKDTNKFEAGPFMKSIITAFTRAATHRQINILVSGLEYNDLSKFRNTISQRVRGVQEVISKGQVGTAANIEVYFAGKTTDFLDELMAKSSAFGFNIKIMENYPNKVRMDVKINK